MTGKNTCSVLLLKVCTLGSSPSRSPALCMPPVTSNSALQKENNCFRRKRGENFPCLGKKTLGTKGWKALGLAKHSTMQEAT